MRRVLDIIRWIWVISLCVLGLWLGIAVGYENGGWIGAVCLGVTGLLLGAFIGAGGARLMLQLLS